MWLILRIKFLVPLSAALVAVLAAIPSSPAPGDEKPGAAAKNLPRTIDKNKTVSFSKNFPNALVVHGKGTSKPARVVLSTSWRTNNKRVHVDLTDYDVTQFKSFTHNKLTAAELDALLKAAEPHLKQQQGQSQPQPKPGKPDPKPDKPNLWPVTLTPRVPWVQKEGAVEAWLDRIGNANSDLSDPAHYTHSNAYFFLHFKCSRTGTYLITFHLGFPAPLTLGIGSGVNEADDTIYKFKEGPATLPILFTVPGVDYYAWYLLRIHDEFPGGKWAFYSVDIKYMEQKK